MPPSNFDSATEHLSSAPSSSVVESIFSIAGRRFRDDLRAGRPRSDVDFDRFLPVASRTASGVFWTPVSVAVRAARWLTEFGVQSVLDVGSGAGKFCVVAASSSSLRVVGLEHRRHLVSGARALACDLDVSDQVSFIEGELGRVALPEVDAYYFYNPFAESIFEPEERLDDTVQLTIGRYASDLSAAEELLRQAPIGTFVVTYNGMGAPMPDDFARRRVDRSLPCVLRLFQKTPFSSQRSSLRACDELDDY